MMCNMGNNNLWDNFLKGDKKALALLFQVHYEELFSYGRKLSGSKNLTEDCLQDLFLKLWINREKLPEIKNLKAFLFTSYRNLIIDCLRWQQRFVNHESNTNTNLHIEFSAEDILIRKHVDLEAREVMLNTLNRLTERQKEAIYLRFFDELSFESIAQVMDINVQSVRNCIHRGIQALREIFPKEA